LVLRTVHESRKISEEEQQSTEDFFETSKTFVQLFTRVPVSGLCQFPLLPSAPLPAATPLAEQKGTSHGDILVPCPSDV
jgi:hypothetical protein